jgi:glutamate/tyrosine decarboxylase-like PLP-dependent enzyme
MASESPHQSALECMTKLVEDHANDEEQAVDASAWFLGPKAENSEALQKLVKMAVDHQKAFREQYMPDDPPFSTNSAQHKASIKLIQNHLEKMLDLLKSSIPLASYRNLSHMYWDITLPGAVGYFAAMLYNQNNVAAEASPVTTMFEITVGKDLCDMLFGQPNALTTVYDSPITPWGHITCDGSIANGESMWAARNLKFLAVAVAAAIKQEPVLAPAKLVTVKTCRGMRARLVDLNTWDLLNLPVDEVIGLIDKIVTQCAIEQATVLDALKNYLLQEIGLIEFQQHLLETVNQATPVVMVPATAHYSWAKTATLIGLGIKAVKLIEVDLDGRMSMVALRQELDRCLNNGIPVLQVVAVLGSTEEGAIDPLAEIVKLRQEYQELGLNFVIHVDAAWGGYFASIMRKSDAIFSGNAADIDRHPELYINDYFRKQYSALPEADSITVDPHKSGFIPYPAGGLCYRNGNMRLLIKYTAPVVFHGGIDPTVGSYGIEGSKPGAAAASVYLSHKVIPLNTSGYGRLLGRCLFNSKRFYAALVSMDIRNKNPQQEEQYERDTDPDQFNCVEEFLVTPFQRLPSEKLGATPHQVFAEKAFIKTHIVPLSTKDLIESITKDEDLFETLTDKDYIRSITDEDLIESKTDEDTEKRTFEYDRKAHDLFQKIGSDLSIVAYAFNFKINNKVNRNLALMNELNENIFRRLSLQPEKDEVGKTPSVDMFVTSSSFDPAAYGQQLVDDFAKRAGIDISTMDNSPIKFLISTTQNPWLTTNKENKNMVNELIEVLRTTVIEERDKIITKYGLGTLRENVILRIQHNDVLETV